MTANKLEGKARELLAEEYERTGNRHAIDYARTIRSGIDLSGISLADDIALRAIEAALDTARQSEGMVLVPREPTDEMLIAAGTVSGWDGNPHNADTDHIAWWKAMLAAAPADAGEVDRG